MNAVELRELAMRAESREAECEATLTFRVGGQTVGQFYYDEEDHDFKFDGETDASARVFVGLCMKEFREQLRKMRN